MYIARVLYPVEVLGPGKRVGVWFSGCPRRCAGCSNPELWEFQDKYKTTPERVYELVKHISQENQIDGFTITGGDPLFQPDELQRLIELIKEFSSDILVYTGYKIEEIPKEQLKNISVLIDGEYIESLNNNCILKGSSNQEIHILDNSVEGKYQKYISSESNKIQNFMTTDGIISVGIHKPAFIEELNSNISKKGLESKNE